MAKETVRAFKMPAGDNRAEARMGCIKNNLRRMGQPGRLNVLSKTKRVQVLASARLHRRPGVAVLEAQMYRQALSKGRIRLSPRDAFNVDTCEWLEV